MNKSLIINIISIIFLMFHLIISILYKKKLLKLKPYAWVKEELNKVNIFIKSDIIAVILFLILFVVILLL